MTTAIRSSGKGKRSSWFLLLELIFVVSLLSNMVIYGGIPSLSQIGSGLEKSVAKQSQLVHFYMAGGQWLMGVPGLEDASHQVLHSALGTTGIRDIAAEPRSGALALTGRSYSSTHSLLNTLRWITPVFFLLSIGGLYFRPRQVKSFR